MSLKMMRRRRYSPDSPDDGLFRVIRKGITPFAIHRWKLLSIPSDALAAAVARPESGAEGRDGRLGLGGATVRRAIPGGWRWQ